MFLNLLLLQVALDNKKTLTTKHINKKYIKKIKDATVCDCIHVRSIANKDLSISNLVHIKVYICTE